jgi:hypothetical protein
VNRIQDLKIIGHARIASLPALRYKAGVNLGGVRLYMGRSWPIVWEHFLEMSHGKHRYEAWRRGPPVKLKRLW